MWRLLKVNDRRSAIAAATLLEQTAQRQKSAQHIRKVFGDLYRDFYGEGMPSATVRAYSEQWLEQKRPETAESSHAAYKKTISVFLDFLAERADRDLAYLTRSDIMRFRNELAKRLGADTVNRYVKIVRMFFKSAHRDGYLLREPGRTRRCHQGPLKRDPQAVYDWRTPGGDGGCGPGMAEPDSVRSVYRSTPRRPVPADLGKKSI